MLSGLSLTALALLAIAGVILDMLLGETRRWHPLVGFGRLATVLERQLNPLTPARSGGKTDSRLCIWYGALGWTLAVAPIVLLTIWVLHILPLAVAFGLHAVLLYFCLGLRSLRDHTLPIAQALAVDDLVVARDLTSRIVSRDNSQAQSTDLSKAAVESLLENGNDAVFGTLFWFVVAGAPGAVLFRLVNTLDAMWGYRTLRYNLYGRVAARIDDGLNWIPARLTALSYAVLGQTRVALQCWRQQAPAWPSPNAGPVMATGAGALGLCLGGAATYDGVLELRPPLGSGAEAGIADIQRAWQLLLRTTILWLVVLSGLPIIFAVIYVVN